jgi:hypothetical protein
MFVLITYEKEWTMAIAMTVDNPNGSPEQYEQVQAQLGLGASPPAGAIFQMSGPGPDGGWRVVSVWETEAEASRFWDERVRPALEAAGGDPEAVRSQIWRLHGYRK